MITTLELFEAFYEACRTQPIEEVIKAYGGGMVYVPSYKQTYRDADLYREYKEGVDMRTLKQTYNLSDSRIRKIIRTIERAQTPSLFDEEER